MIVYSLVVTKYERTVLPFYVHSVLLDLAILAIMRSGFGRVH
jgi:hypothetical protein